jgi:putative GTP pyrophosphokinase
MPTDAEVTDWYNQKRATFASLAENASSSFKALLSARRVDILAVSHRTKTLESVIEKVGRKDYSDLSEITDLAGVRVIAYIESDVQRAADLIAEAFVIDKMNSVDKSHELQDDKFGYRSVHFVCELGDARTALPELAAFKGLKFEIQIRTVLQHAWAEIEHDRSYKFSGELPSHIRRRLNLLAGVLELADREFGMLAHEVDEYQKRIQRSVKEGALDSEELTTISLEQYFKLNKNLQIHLSTSKKNHASIDEVVGELKRFGVLSVDELGKLLSKDFLDALAQPSILSTPVGLLRRAMLFTDPRRYFERAWWKKWNGISAETRALLVKRHGEVFIASVLKEFGVKSLALKK